MAGDCVGENVSKCKYWTKRGRPSLTSVKGTPQSWPVSNPEGRGRGVGTKQMSPWSSVLDAIVSMSTSDVAAQLWKKSWRERAGEEAFVLVTLAKGKLSSAHPDVMGFGRDWKDDDWDLKENGDDQRSSCVNSIKPSSQTIQFSHFSKLK